MMKSAKQAGHHREFPVQQSFALILKFTVARRKTAKQAGHHIHSRYLGPNGKKWPKSSPAITQATARSEHSIKNKHKKTWQPKNQRPNSVVISSDPFTARKFLLVAI
ncbi:hypothetical protein AVEN_254799-1 [Araneus ventricosus]|uniref:Uncharacterized protein n=1 Tax=Araneus ventricosus TaxID=182803 RepID=A0A4Y2HT23_ARAVE|nr:hypothetical protein AVEN_6137-1 [Araneus ventricosus]GBM68625.1 hypothetical protein AVEN_217011-1 [Araneus ventricosus]GBM68879.1 hypothetical protein AVEN_266593-1 [Araneus ventricosus]GBO31276.1 hypothetical protein AVEN_254799-1 [Araneus ventricosus]